MNQLLLLPESTELVGSIMGSVTLKESFTSTQETLLVPLGSMFHWSKPLPPDLLRFIRLPEAPVIVRVPFIVCVEPEAKLSVLPASVQVKLLNVVLPDTVAGLAPVNFTVHAALPEAKLNVVVPVVVKVWVR